MTPRAEDQRLIAATEEALTAAIAVAVPGNRLGDISAAIGAVAADYGYPVRTEFVLLIAGRGGAGRTWHLHQVPRCSAPATASSPSTTAGRRH